MSTLHDRLVYLADQDADVTRPSPTGAELWDRGLRIRRERRIAVTAVLSVAAALLVALGVLTWVRLPHAETRPADSPAGAPDHLYAPSPRLPGTDDDGPLGQLAAVFPAPRGGRDDPALALAGISATTGAYRFLDLPDQSSDAGFQLAPDGRHLAYWTRGRAARATDPVDTGVAVYDTATGRTRIDPIASDYGLQQEQLHWAGSGTLVIDYQLSTSTSVHADGSVEGQQPQPTLVWDLSQPRPEPAPRAWSGVVAASADTLVTYDSRLRTIDARTGRVLVRFPAVEGFIGQPAPDPTGTRLAILLGKTAPGQTGFRSLGPVTVMTAEGARLVPGSTQADEIVGWSDARHVLVEAQVGPDRHTTVLASLDVHTGDRRTLATYADDFPATGVEFASDLAAFGIVPAVRPASPRDPWPIAALAAAILGGAALGIAGLIRRSGRRRVGF